MRRRRIGVAVCTGVITGVMVTAVGAIIAWPTHRDHPADAVRVHAIVEMSTGRPASDLRLAGLQQQECFRWCARSTDRMDASTSVM